MNEMIATKRENPILQLVREEPLIFKSSLSREKFHRFVLSNPDLKIERDKHGVITIHSPMTFDSGYFEGLAFTKLSVWSIKSRLGRAFSPSTSFDLPDGSEYKADGAWISNEKINRLSEEERRHIASIVPDFVMEVRSESDRLAKLKKKMTEAWMDNGVKLAWLIDPVKQKAWVFRTGAPVEEIDNFDQILSGGDILPGFEFDLSDLKV